MSAVMVKRFTDSVAAGLTRIIAEQRGEIADILRDMQRIDASAKMPKPKRYGTNEQVSLPELRVEYAKLKALGAERTAAVEWLEYQLAKRGEG